MAELPASARSILSLRASWRESAVGGGGQLTPTRRGGGGGCGSRRRWRSLSWRRARSSDLFKLVFPTSGQRRQRAISRCPRPCAPRSRSVAPPLLRELPVGNPLRPLARPAARPLPAPPTPRALVTTGRSSIAAGHRMALPHGLSAATAGRARHCVSLTPTPSLIWGMSPPTPCAFAGGSMAIFLGLHSDA